MWLIIKCLCHLDITTAFCNKFVFIQIFFVNFFTLLMKNWRKNMDEKKNTLSAFRGKIRISLRVWFKENIIISQWQIWMLFLQNEMTFKYLTISDVLYLIYKKIKFFKSYFHQDVQLIFHKLLKQLDNCFNRKFCLTMTNNYKLRR